MKARELDRQFDAGEDVTKHLDLSMARRPQQEQSVAMNSCVSKLRIR